MKATRRRRLPTRERTSAIPEFFSLHRSLEAYRNSIGQPNDVLVISPKGEFFKYFKQSGR